MTLGKIIVWLIIGALAGTLAGRLVTFSKQGLGFWTNIGLGMLGAWPVPARNAKTSPNLAPRADEWPRKSPLLDRDLACLKHRSFSNTFFEKKGRLKFLFPVLLWWWSCLSTAVLTTAPIAAAAADLEPVDAAPISSLAERQNLTDDWFGRAQVMRDAGLDLRFECSQFYHGLTKGQGDKSWEYGGKWDAQARVDLAKLGFWNGLSVTAQGNFNYGESVNGIAGSLIPVNAALFFPGIEGADSSDVMALYVQQNFGDRVSILAGKLNLVEFARGTPLRGGGGVDTFWNVNLATPITGDSPPTIYGAQVRVNTQPVSFSVTVFDAQDATNPLCFPICSRRAPMSWAPQPSRPPSRGGPATTESRGFTARERVPISARLFRRRGPRALSPSRDPGTRREHLR